MTVSTTDVGITYPGDGATRDFGFAIPFLSAGELRVTLIDHATGVAISPAPVLNGGATYDYILQAVEPPPNLTYPTGANVRFNTAPLAGWDIVLKRDTTQVQPIALVDDAKFPAGTVNLEFDRLTMIDQEQQQGLDFIFGLLPLLATGQPLLGLIMKWRNLWAANTSYGIGDTVLGPGNGLYVCTQIHTSGASFDNTKFDLAVDMTALAAAVAQAQAAAIVAQAAAATIPAPGGAGNAGFVPAVNTAGTAYALRSALLALVADPTNKWDGQNKLLTNVRTAVSANDAVNLAQMNAAIVASGAVPAPGAPDVDKVLTATGVGTFGWLFMTLARISDMSAYMRGLNAAANAAAALASLGGVSTARQILAGTNLTGGGDLTADRTITHAVSAVTPGSYLAANITVDARGHVTAAANGAAGGGAAIVSGGAHAPVLADNGKEFIYTAAGGCTVTLPAASTLADGWKIGMYSAPGAGAITMNANGADRVVTKATPLASVVIPSPGDGGELILGTVADARFFWRGKRSFTTADWQLVLSTDNITAHTLGVRPDDVWMYLVCGIANVGYAVNDVVNVLFSNVNSGAGGGLWCDATNIHHHMSNSAWWITNKTTQAVAATTTADWKGRVKVQQIN